MSNLYLNELDRVAAGDVKALLHAEKSYGDSWKKRGGIGAFMMLARKWDRLEKRVANPPLENPVTAHPLDCDVEKVLAFDRFDIFGAVETDQRAEGVIDDIRDLRRYLLLVEAELIATNRCPGTLPKDVEAGCASKGSTS
jgi:hypothetical protein